MEMENEQQLPEAVVEKVSLSEINAEKEAITSEEDEVVIKELFSEIAQLTSEEKAEMMRILDERIAKADRIIEESKKKNDN